jgi:hypothetical protein
MTGPMLDSDFATDRSFASAKLKAMTLIHPTMTKLHNQPVIRFSTWKDRSSEGNALA